MSLFKTKNKKTYITDNRITLDAKHNEMLKHFKELNKSLPNKKKKLEMVYREYEALRQIPNKDLNNDDLHKKFQLKDEINELKKEIKNIETHTEENDYYLNTAPLLYKYYDNIESIAASPPDKDSILKNTCVLDFFGVGMQPPLSPIQKLKNTNQPKDMSDYVNTTEKFQRADYLNEFLKKVDPNYINILEYNRKYDICDQCNVEKILHQSEGIMVCEECGEIDFIVIDSDKPSYKDPPPEVSYFAYKRINHFVNFFIRGFLIKCWNGIVKLKILLVKENT